MSARKAAGNVPPPGVSPAGGRADALTAFRGSLRSVLTWAPSGQAFACKPNLAAPASWQGVKATAPGPQGRGFEPRPAGAEPVFAEGAPSARITDPRKPQTLAHHLKGDNMEKTAAVFICLTRKSFPINDLQPQSAQNGVKARKPMNRQKYTLCEVRHGKEQFISVDFSVALND